MTWSVVRFISLPPSRQSGSEDVPVLPYRLLKFVDARDWRFTHLLDANKPDKNDGNTFEAVSGTNWCNPANDLPPGHIVLYVPGHEGQYQQARSIGAHGINLTFQSDSMSRRHERDLIEQLWDGTKNASAEIVDDFVFDVYTVDFNGEGGGLHGSRLFAQSKFVSMSLERIQNECGNNYADYITVVAHSLGGLVARRAILETNKKRLNAGEKPLVQNLITLASPHLSIPLIFDSSVYRFHSTLIQDEKSFESQHNDAIVSLVSISGGLRDELIPPSACEARKQGSLSFLASDVLPQRTEMLFHGERLGMDHKAIVWCQGLLSVVRELIHSFVMTSGTSSLDKISKVVNGRRTFNHSFGEECDFRCQNNQKDEFLVKEYGLLGAFAIRTSMLPNCRALAILYSLNSTIHFCCTFRSIGNIKRVNHEYSYAFVPLMSSMLFVCFVDDKELGIWSTILLAFNAMNIYFVLLRAIFPAVSCLLRRLLQLRNSHKSASLRQQASAECTIKFYLMRQLWAMIILCSLGFISFASFSKCRKEPMVVNIVSVGGLLFLALVAQIILNILQLGCWPRQGNESQKILASILFVVFPLSAIGKVIFALSLLTKLGQTKSLPFVHFEELEWDKFCNSRTSMNGLVCAVPFFRYDLFRFATVICIPVSFLMIWIQYRSSTNVTVMKKER